jgi:hypothetical protein
MAGGGGNPEHVGEESVLINVWVCCHVLLIRHWVCIGNWFTALITRSTNLHNWLILCSWALLERPPVVRHSVEPEGPLPHSQLPSTCPYPEPDQSSPHRPIFFSFATKSCYALLVSQMLQGSSVVTLECSYFSSVTSRQYWNSTATVTVECYFSCSFSSRNK